MEKYKRPPLQQEPNVYIEPKWLRCPQCCSGLELIGPAHEDLETPEAVLGQALRLEVILLSKEKAAAPRPKPRGRPRGTGRQTLQNLPNPQPPSKPSKPSKTLQTPPQQAPQGQGHFSIRPPGPRPQQWLSIGFQSCRLPARKHSKRSKTLQTLQTPSKTLQTLQAWRHALSRWPKGYGS